VCDEKHKWEIKSAITISTCFIFLQIHIIDKPGVGGWGRGDKKKGQKRERTGLGAQGECL